MRILGWAVLLAAISGCSGADTIWCCADEDNDLVTVLKDNGYRIVLSDDVQTTLDKAPEGAAVLLLNRSYPDSVRLLSGQQVSKIGEKGLRVFAEFASTADTLPQLHEIGFERVVMTDSLAPGLGPMDLLSINRGRYFREDAAEGTVMAIAKVAGFDTAVYGLDDTPCYPLVYRKRDGLWMSTSQLSEFARLRFMPEAKWKVFWEKVIGDLTGHETRFSSWIYPVHPSYGKDVPLPDTARLASVRKGVEWFYNGHFLVDASWKKDWIDKYQGDGVMPIGPCLPPDIKDGDGSCGILEGHCSRSGDDFCSGREPFGI